MRSILTPSLSRGARSICSERGERRHDERDVNETGIIARVVNILISPNTEWRVIAAERVTAGDIFYKYVLPLAAIPPVISLFGFALAGRIGFGAGFLAALLYYVVAVGAVFFIAVVAQYLSPKFGGRDDFVQATKLIVYAATASWVGGLFLLFPALWPLHLLLALYGLYLIYAGCAAVMAVPPAQAGAYTIAVIATELVTYGAISIVLGIVFRMGAMGMMM